MDIKIKVEEGSHRNQSFIYLFSEKKNSNMKLIVTTYKNYLDITTCNIDDIEGGEATTDYHRQGVGTAMMYYFLEYAVKTFGNNTRITRTDIKHGLNDTTETENNRYSFWSKCALGDKTDENLAIVCLDQMKQNVCLDRIEISFNLINVT